jgi:outer membrane protein assembly factor BamB
MPRYALALALLAVLLLCPARAGDLKEELWAAARKGDAAAVEDLLARGVDVNAKNAYGATALSFATDKGHLEVVRVLLKHKADVNVSDTFYKATPLSWAVSKGNPAIVEALLKAGAKGADKYLASAARIGKPEVVRTILDNAKVDQASLDQALAAAPKTRPEVGEILRKAGAKESAAPAAKIDPQAVKPYLGVYRNDDRTELKLVLEGERLLLKMGPFSLYELQPVEAGTFRSASDDKLTFRFERDGERVTGFTQKANKTETRYQRFEPRKQAPDAVKDDGPVRVASPANWPSFRGANASGVADGQQPPVVWDAEKGHNLRWKKAIPGLGHSCPVVWGERIFLTSAVSGDAKAALKAGQYGNVDSVKDLTPHTWYVYCLDRGTGEVVWERVAHKGVPKVKRHAKATHANPTCATDGTHIVAGFGSEGLYCYDFAGKQLWKQDLGTLDAGWFYDPDYQWGFGSSPIIYKGLVIVQCDVGKGSFVAAYEVASGKRVWQTPREEIPSWGTPTVVESNGQAELVTNGTKFVRGYDPLTGKELWRLGGNSEITVPTPVAGHGLIFVSSGYRLPRPVWAIRPGGRGDITPPKGKTEAEFIAWSNRKEGTYMPTPIVYGAHLYTCSNDGVVTCYDARTGKRLYWERLGSDGGFTASPVAADGRLYFTGEEGLVYVVKAGPAFELLAVNRVGDPCLATPAICDGMLLVRSQRCLYAFGRPPAQKGSGR